MLRVYWVVVLGRLNKPMVSSPRRDARKLLCPERAGEARTDVVSDFERTVLRQANVLKGPVGMFLACWRCRCRRLVTGLNWRPGIW